MYEALIFWVPDSSLVSYCSWNHKWNFYIVIMTGSLNLRSELVLLAQMSATPLVRKGPRESEVVAMYVPLSVEVECENATQFHRVM